MLGKALVTNIPKLISKVPQVISSLVSAFIGALGAIANIGTHIVQGIWNGIVGSLSWLKDKISGWVGNVVDFIKKMFKISSPSKLMRDEVGKYIALGLWEGWDENNPIDMIKNDLTGFEKGMAVSVNTVGRSGSSGNTIIDYDRLADATVTAFTRAGIGIEIDKREFGRITRGVIAYG
jgi:phage-related protein